MLKGQSRRDVFLLILFWYLWRLPLLLFHLPPLVQVDSLCYHTLEYTLSDPHYPILYGVFLNFFHPLAVLAIQHLMVLAMALCLYHVAKKIGGRASGLAAGLFVATYGNFVLYAQSYMSEILFNFFLALFVLFLFRAVTRESWKWFFLGGLAAGLATNVRALLLYEPLVLALVLLPFYLRSRTGWKVYAKSVAALLIGFALVLLPVAAAVWKNTGRFTLTTGLACAASYRLVWDESAPLDRVEVDDPVLARVRDYLAGVGKDDDIIWLKAFQHIREDILGLPTEKSGEVAPLVMKLWRSYVITYPWEYLRFSLLEAWGVMGGVPILAEQAAFSEETLSLSPESRFSFIRDLPVAGPRDLRVLQQLYFGVLFFPARARVVLCVLLAGLFLALARAPGPARRYLACFYPSMLYVWLPQFAATIGVPRYRLPFDLMYALPLGLVVGFMVSAIRERNPRAALRAWREEAP